MQYPTGSYRLRQAYPLWNANDQELKQEITDHKNAKNNPHQVTATQVGAETPAGAQAKANAVQANLDAHEADTVAHVTEAEHTKLAGIQEGAEVNQNAFASIEVAGQPVLSADGKSATLRFKNGTGIVFTTNPTTGEITATATGEAIPGAHGSSHDPDGADPIPALDQVIDDVSDLAGAGRTTETVKGNADDIAVVASDVAAQKADFEQLESDYNTRVVKPTQQITAPVGLGYTPPFIIPFIKPDGKAAIHGFDVSSLAPTGKKYYVDANIGNNSNDGLTPNTALKRIADAIAKSDVVEVILAPGVYARTNAMNSGVINKTVSIKAEGGRAVITAHDELTWAVSAGYTYTYEATRSSVGNVFDTKLVDKYGDYMPLVQRASIADVNANPGSWYSDGTKVYVRTRDSRVVDNTVRAYLTVNNIRNTGNFTLYLENVDIEGGPAAVRVENSAAGQNAKVYAKNCSFKYAISADSFRTLGADSILQDCVAAQGFLDGFNYHAQNGFAPTAVEINCIGRNNGLRDGGGTNNGSTMHDAGTVVRVNGEYFGNSGPNVADVISSKSWNVCVISRNAASTASVNFWNEYLMWLDSCQSYGSIVDLDVRLGGTTYRRNLLSAGNNNVIDGSIVPY